jgi:hypothetical protein
MADLINWYTASIRESVWSLLVMEFLQRLGSGAGSRYQLIF